MLARMWFLYRSRAGLVMRELSWNGDKSLTMADGSERTFLKDGDTVIIHGYAKKDGVRIGFGECKGKILSSH